MVAMATEFRTGERKRRRMAGWAREEGRTTQTPQHPVSITPEHPPTSHPARMRTGTPSTQPRGC